MKNDMKKIILPLILTLLLLSACGDSDFQGKTDDVSIDVGTSDLFTTSEIEAAAERVLVKFKDFEDCELTKLWYDEERSIQEVSSHHQTAADPDNGIVLLSNFDVGSSGGDGSLDPNSTYQDWMWILKRDSADSQWEVVDWGY